MNQKAPSRRPAPFSLRLTPEERSRLEKDAGHLSVSAYAKSRLFDGASVPVRARVRFPVQDQAALAALLGKLGQSRIANNLNELARAANMGALDLTPELQTELHEACANVAAIRVMLITALGLSGSSDGEL